MKMNGINRKVWLLAGALSVALLLIIWTIWGNSALMVSQVSIASDRLPAAFSGYRIAHISDLHNAEFGDGNGKLLRMLADLDPDMIAITGDLIDSRHTDINIAIQFAEGASQIAPTYYVTGNHEARISEYKTLKGGLEAAGVTVLSDEKVLLERGGDTVALLGLNDPSFHAAGGWGGDDAATVSGKLDNLHGQDDSYTILLSHRPELFQTYADGGIDLILSGHAHGGQFRLPLIGGLVAPNQGFFPKYDAGCYSENSTNMVVSRGLGNSIIPIRFNNRPEIVLVELTKA